MDPGQLHALIAGGETMTVEFKRGDIDTDDLIEAVVCLANADGGRVLVGLDERSQEVTGARPWPRMGLDPVRIEAHIAANTEPALRASVEVILDGDHSVVVVLVPPAETVVSTGRGKFIRRAIDVHGRPQCLPMRPHEVVARAFSTGERDFTRTPVPELSTDDLDSVEFDRLRTMVRREHGDSVLSNLRHDDLLAALELLDHRGQLNVAALLLFGKQEALRRHAPSSEVAFQHLTGSLEVRANDIGHIPLLKAIVELSERVQARNAQEEVQLGLFRVSLPLFAEVTVRELIANALTHRDHSALGQTRVVIDDAGLEVSNPGGFPVGVTLANLLTTPPRPRNPLLADVFKRAGLVERARRGISRVFLGQLQIGRQPPDFTRSNASTVVVRVSAGPADREFAGFVDEARREGRELSLAEMQVLQALRSERFVTARDAADLVQSDTRSGNALLQRLVEKGMVEPRGRGRGREYQLSAALYRRFEEESQHVRARGYDRIQQEQMILAFVRTHGSIARRQAADLCQLDSASAALVLRALRDRGDLVLVGERRTARYVLPEEDS